MIESHEIVTRNKSVKRGGAFQSTASGKMVPIGLSKNQGSLVSDNSFSDDVGDYLMLVGTDSL